MPHARPSRRHATSRDRARFLALGGFAVVAALVLATVITPAGAAMGARPGQAIGGGGVQTPEEIILPSGGEFDGLFPLYITNPNRSVLALRIEDKAPSGITITPRQRTVNVSPGATVRVPYSLRVDSTMPAGRYAVEIAAVPGPAASRENEVRFINAIVQRYTVAVSGAAGDLRARAVDNIDDQPVTGVFIASRLSGVAPVPVARTEGPLFTARLVPGDYEIAFEAEGRRVASKQVKVTEGETTDARLEVSLLQFTNVEATEIDADGKLGAVALTAQFDNVLRPIRNMVFALEVSRDGKTIDTIDVQRFDTLAKGSGSVSTRYVPPGGWANGKYEFRFRMVAESFTVAAAQRPVVRVGPASAAVSWWVWATGIALLALLLLGLLVWFLRRRSQHDDHKGSPAQPKAGKALQPTA